MRPQAEVEVSKGQRHRLEVQIDIFRQHSQPYQLLQKEETPVQHGRGVWNHAKHA